MRMRAVIITKVASNQANNRSRQAMGTNQRSVFKNILDASTSAMPMKLAIDTR